jgi:hypothetical protein
MVVMMPLTIIFTSLEYGDPTRHSFCQQEQSYWSREKICRTGRLVLKVSRPNPLFDYDVHCLGPTLFTKDESDQPARKSTQGGRNHNVAGVTLGWPGCHVQA